MNHGYDRNGIRTNHAAGSPPLADAQQSAAAAASARSVGEQALDRVREELAGQVLAPATPAVEPDPAAAHGDLVEQVGRSRDEMLQRLGRRPSAEPVTLARPAAAIEAAPAVEPLPGQQAEVHDALAQMRQALRLPPT